MDIHTYLWKKSVQSCVIEHSVIIVEWCIFGFRSSAYVAFGIGHYDGDQCTHIYIYIYIYM